MKQLVCEMCGSTDLMKQDGVFVCQTCGCKYSVEEAKKMMVEGTVEVVGTVKIDNNDNYRNLVQLAADAFIDGRYESAYKQCTDALAINSNDAEIIAMQGLAVLGKEPITTDVPSSCVNALNRMANIISSNPEAYEKNLETLKNVTKYLNSVCSVKTDELNEQIKVLQQQLVPYNPTAHKAAAANYAMQALGGNVFTQQSAKADCEKYEQAANHNIQINTQISKIRDIQAKISNFKDSSLKRITSSRNNIARLLDEKNKAEQAARNEKYWEEHAAEKAEIESKISSLSEEISEVEKQLEPSKSEIEKIRRRPAPAAKAESELKNISLERNQIYSEMGKLSIFQGKRKKELQNDLNILAEREKELKADVEAEEREYKRNVNQEINEIEEAIKPMRDRLAQLREERGSLEEELKKDR